MAEKKTLKLNSAWCKGCGICEAFCPVNVLKLDKGKIKIENPDSCISCGQCEMRCPDYAIWLEGGEE